MEAKDVAEMVNKALDDREEVARKAQQEEGAKTGLADAIKGIGDRLDTMDESFCQKFPDLCTRVEAIEQTLTTPKLEKGSDEWNASRKADLDHILFEECPDCNPIRDEVLKGKGKRLTDVEPPKDEVKDEKGTEEVEVFPTKQPGTDWSWEYKGYVKTD